MAIKTHNHEIVNSISKVKGITFNDYSLNLAMNIGNQDIINIVSKMGAKYKVNYTGKYRDILTYNDQYMVSTSKCPKELKAETESCIKDYIVEMIDNTGCCVPNVKKIDINKITDEQESILNEKVNDYLKNNKTKNFVLLYTFNGDVLLNSYIRNNRKINETIKQYYLEHMDVTFNKYLNVIDCKKDSKLDSDKFIKCYIDFFDKQLLNARITLPFDIVLKRYLKTNIKNFKINSFILHLSYISCTTKPANDSDNQSLVYFRIYVPSGTPLIPILFNSKLPMENEILLDYNCSFYIYDIKDIYVYAYVIYIKNK